MLDDSVVPTIIQISDWRRLICLATLPIDIHAWHILRHPLPSSPICPSGGVDTRLLQKLLSEMLYFQMCLRDDGNIDMMIFQSTSNWSIACGLDSAAALKTYSVGGKFIALLAGSTGMDGFGTPTDAVVFIFTRAHTRVLNLCA